MNRNMLMLAAMFGVGCGPAVPLSVDTEGVTRGDTVSVKVSNWDPDPLEYVLCLEADGGGVPECDGTPSRIGGNTTATVMRRLPSKVRGQSYRVTIRLTGSMEHLERPVSAHFRVE